MTQTSSQQSETIDWRNVPWTLPEPTRERVELDGTWDFSPDPDGAITVADWQDDKHPTDLRQIRVPIPWQAQFEDLREYMGVGWYRRSISIPADWQSSTVVLHIGAADYFTEAWLDGELLGQHEGGYLPFEFRLPANGAGEAELVIKVTDPSDNRARFPDMPFDEIPHGKQSWYGPVGGIWQSVYLEKRTASWVEQIFTTPDIAGGAVDVAVALNEAPGDGAAQVTLILRDTDGNEVGRQELALQPTAAEGTIPAAAIYAEDGRLFAARLAVPNARLWSPDDPALYSVEAVWPQGEGKDRLITYFGMRKFEAQEGRILLNGEPIYLFAALDQDYYPDTIYTPPSTDFLFDQFKKAREMGLNMLRCHIKVADPRYYEIADRMGIMIWTEIPNWANRTLAAGRRGYETFKEMVRRDWNHASIVIWTLINEDWGIELRFNRRDREWLSQFYGDAKQYDPTRLVVDNSACFHNFHMRSDIEDYHNYYTIPDHRQKWDRWVKSLASHAFWTYEHNVDDMWEHPDYLEGRGFETSDLVQRSGKEPIVLSEFGNWGLPKLGPLWESHGGKEPWWFATGFDWGPVYPHDVEYRFKYYHMDKIFGTYDALCEKSQQQQYLAMKYEIETIRRYSAICGYVITEFTDVHWECNGLLDMARTPKIYHNEMVRLNHETMIIPRAKRYSYWTGDTARFRLHLSHWGRQSLEGGTLSYSSPEIGLGGSTPIPVMQHTSTVHVTDLGWVLPEIDAPVKARIQFKVLLADGTAIADSYEDVYVFPRAMRQGSGKTVGVWYDDRLLSAKLTDLGYETVDMPGADVELSIASQVTPELQDYVQRGGRVLVLVTNDTAFSTQVDGIHVAERSGRSWEGDWATNYNWYRQDIAFKSLPGDGRFDLAFSEIAPHYVLTGVGARHFESDVLSGIFVGWLRDQAALAVVRRHGYGHFLLTTLNLVPQLNRDTIAVRLLHELLEHLWQVP